MSKLLILEIGVTIILAAFLLQNVVYTQSLADYCDTPVIGDIGKVLFSGFAATCGEGYAVALILDIAGWIYIAAIILVILGILVALK